MTPTAVAARQTLGAQLARAQLLIMRGFEQQITDERSEEAASIVEELTQILLKANADNRSTIVAGLESCITVLERRYRDRNAAPPETIRAMEASMHSIVLQASALATQISMLEAESRSLPMPTFRAIKIAETETAF